MKNYLYIPLGGNKKSSEWLTYRNLWVVFFVSGLWHGASWTFVIWGLYHGLFIVIERILKGRLPFEVQPAIRMFFTFFIVTIGWVFFRIENINLAKIYLNSMFSFNNLPANTFETSFWFYFFLAILFSVLVVLPGGKRIKDFIYGNHTGNKQHLVMASICTFLLVLSVLSISSSGFNPFIYFRF